MELSLPLAALAILGGLALLTFGGNVLVDGAVSIAKRLKISQAIIGLTIVAIGTSLPELIVSVTASLQGNTEIAIANVTGSNIANIFLILGLSAIIAPVLISKTARKFDIPFVIFTTLLLLLMTSDVLIDGASGNLLGRIDGIILLTVAVAYILYSIKHHSFDHQDEDLIESSHSLGKALVWIGGGMVALLIGGKLLVDGAVTVATSFGLSETIIGLTIVAIGTSAPELATSIIAARKGNSDIALGNVVGSNIMNILIILGVSSTIAPLPFLDSGLRDILIGLMAPIMILILGYLGRSHLTKHHTLTRVGGGVLVSIYIAYVIMLIVQEIR